MGGRDPQAVFAVLTADDLPRRLVGRRLRDMPVLAQQTVRFIGERVFDAVLVQREGASRDTDPVAPLAAALDGGASLILFPEGTRSTNGAWKACRSTS